MSKQNKNKAQKKSGINKGIMLAGILLVAVILIFTFKNADGKQAAAEGEITQEQNNAAGSSEDLTIQKSEVTEKVKFYPYKADGIYMEVIAVKASDGTVRTALNTCQVCFDSGRGYYEQQGDKVVCQNCGNVFRIDDIEKIKNGCNPVPVMSENKTEDSEKIVISKAFLSDNSEYFKKWKK